MDKWMSHLNHISLILRSNSMMGGLVASNIPSIYVLLTVPSPSLETYAAYTLWSVDMYVGLVTGLLTWRTLYVRRSYD
jgi:hypothetical protein